MTHEKGSLVASAQFYPSATRNGARPEKAASAAPPRRHVVIAGTGRAGTSFLVRFLSECGVPAGDLDQLQYFDDARAGLEQHLSNDTEAYLVKDPWFHEYMESLDLAAIDLEAVIIPVRDPRLSALSRVRQERAHSFKHDDLQANRSTYGFVPGGVLYSLSVDDQERVLAVGQARLLAWCLERSIPTCLLHFPRLVNDCEYTVDTLWWLLGQFCDRDHAVAAFNRLAEPEDRLASASKSIGDTSNADMRVEIESLLDALRHVKGERDASAAQCEAYLLSSRRAEQDLAEASAANTALSDEIAALRRRVHELDGEAGGVRAELEVVRIRLALEQEQLATLHADLERTETAVMSARSEVTAADSALNRAEIANGALEDRSTALMNELDAIRRCRSYRFGRALTMPLRLLRDACSRRA